MKKLFSKNQASVSDVLAPVRAALTKLQGIIDERQRQNIELTGQIEDLREKRGENTLEIKAARSLSGRLTELVGDAA